MLIRQFQQRLECQPLHKGRKVGAIPHAKPRTHRIPANEFSGLRIIIFLRFVEKLHVSVIVIHLFLCGTRLRLQLEQILFHLRLGLLQFFQGRLVGALLLQRFEGFKSIFFQALCRRQVIFKFGLTSAQLGEFRFRQKRSAICGFISKTLRHKNLAEIL